MLSVNNEAFSSRGKFGGKGRGYRCLSQILTDSFILWKEFIRCVKSFWCHRSIKEFSTMESFPLKNVQDEEVRILNNVA